MKRLAQSATVMFLASDGVLLALFGRGWVRFTRFGPEESAYVRVTDWFLAWPAWLLRAAGMAEAGIALKLFTQWRPDDEPGTAAG